MTPNTVNTPQRGLASGLLCAGAAQAQSAVQPAAVADAGAPLGDLLDRHMGRGVRLPIIADETALLIDAELARLRLEEAMSSGDIDVRCYVSTQWLNDRPCGQRPMDSSSPEPLGHSVTSTVSGNKKQRHQPRPC